MQYSLPVSGLLKQQSVRGTGPRAGGDTALGTAVNDAVTARYAISQPAVLHVTQAFGAGVATAMAQYAASLPELKHEALVSARDEVVSSQIMDPFAQVTILENLGELSRRYRRLESTSEVIHCHSSWAGVAVRTAKRPSGARIVYSPHALAYSAKRWYEVRSWTRAMEWALRGRADAYGAVSSHEADQLKRLGIPGSKITIVRHFLPVPEQVEPRTPDAVVTVGRVCTQKNPAFFAEAAKRLAGTVGPDGRPLRFFWIGAGDEKYTRLLQESGVTVTGWMDRDALMRFIKERAVVLVHGAHYEAGAPLALLEAMSVGVPVVARRIPSVADITSIPLVEDARQAATAVQELLATGGLDQLAEACRREVRERFSLAAQRSALAELYQLSTT